MTWTLHTHSNADALASAVAHCIAADLDDALAERGQALLAVAAGRSSPPVYRQLAAQPREWSRVTILPSDERWVAAGHPDCNLRQIQQAFAGAAGINWLALVPEAPDGDVDARFANTQLKSHAQAFDLCMLGMGADGHFASLFPGAANLGAGLAVADSASSDAAIALLPDPLPAAGPQPRISLTLQRLLRSRRLLLVISGADKRAIFERASFADPLQLPVAALLNAAHPNAQVHWSP